MNTVIRHTEYLISRHSCVIIPRLGAILVKAKSAVADPQTHIITPPGRAYAFNSGLSHNDGMLASSIARAESISYDKAMRKLETETDSMLMRLHSEGELSLGRLGTLTLDPANGELQYHPAAAESLCLPSMWLRPVELEPLPTHSLVTKHATGKFKKALRYAASIAALIAVCFLASTPIAVDDTAFASLSPELRQAAPDELLPEAPTTLSIISSGYEKSEGQIPVETSLPDSIASDTVSNISDSQTMSQRFIVLVASLSTEAEAHKFVRMHSQDSLTASRKGKHYAVFIGPFDQREEANEARRQVISRYPDAWVSTRTVSSLK